MKILITNLQLWPVRGSESWCYAVGSELVRRGNEVCIYSPYPRDGIKVFEDAMLHSFLTSAPLSL